MRNSPPPEPALRQTHPSKHSSCPKHPKSPAHPTPGQTRPSKYLSSPLSHLKTTSLHAQIQSKNSNLNSPSKIYPVHSHWLRGHEALPTLPVQHWLIVLLGVALLASPAWAGETWGVVSMCPFHCVCRNLSESLSTLCVNKGLLFVPPDIDRRTVELRLADNYILELGGADFSNMTGLVDLTLSRNTLHKLRPLAFSDLESLQSLHLDANRLTRVGTQDLAGLLNLQHLTLNNNQLSYISPDAFTHFLSSLENLDLSYNNLREAPWSSLRNMPTLHALNLDHNLIEHVPEGAFHDLYKLGRLDMTSNRLRTLPPDPLFELGPAPFPPVATSLSFGGNPLHCNCELLWLRRLTRRDDMETCATPAHLAGRYFWAVPEAEFTCEPPIIARHTPRIWALEGQRATLRCRALGDPAPLVHWVSPDDRILGNSSRMRSYRNGTLDVLVTRARDDGTYACIAVNAAGEVSAPVELHIIPLPHHRGNRTAREHEPSDISAGRGGAGGGVGNETAGDREDPGRLGRFSGGRVGVLEVTATTAEVRWHLGGDSVEYLPWMYQIQYNSTADETLMYRMVPPSSTGLQLKNLVAAADYKLCVLAVFDGEGGVASLSSTRVLGCVSFSTNHDPLPHCHALHAHFLGGALSVLVGGAVVVMLLVVTVATMVRHHQHRWASSCHSDRRNDIRGGAGEGDAQRAGSPGPAAKGTSVYSQTNGEGGVTVVAPPKTRPKDLTDLPERGGSKQARRFLPYSPEGERVTLYYPTHPPSATLPSKLRRAGMPGGGAIASSALPEPGPLRSNRSCSFDMGEVAMTTCYGYGRRSGSTWSTRRSSLQGMLVRCTSATSTNSSDSETRLRSHDDCNTGPAHQELEESVV